jgi:hypothetical protein
MGSRSKLKPNPSASGSQISLDSSKSSAPAEQIQKDGSTPQRQSTGAVSCCNLEAISSPDTADPERVAVLVDQVLATRTQSSSSNGSRSRKHICSWEYCFGFNNVDDVIARRSESLQVALYTVDEESGLIQQISSCRCCHNSDQY